jgi:hypothetical protein
MPIQKSTKTILTTFATEQGFTVIDNTATKAKDQWVLSCAEGHESSHTVTTIRQHMHAGTNIVCPTCKTNRKIQKFTEASGVTLTDGNLITCNACELSFRYFGCYYNPSAVTVNTKRENVSMLFTVLYTSAFRATWEGNSLRWCSQM